MHPEDIKAAVRKRGMTLTALAEREGLEPSACRDALIRPRPEGEKAIARFTGLPLHQLWPSRYDEEDRRIVRRGPKRKSDAIVGEVSTDSGTPQRLKRGDDQG